MSYQASPDAQQQRGETPEAQTVLSEVDSKLPTPLPIVSASSVGFSAERLNRMDPAMQTEIDAGHYAGIRLGGHNH